MQPGQPQRGSDEGRSRIAPSGELRYSAWLVIRSPTSFAAGVPIKAISEMLGHATSAFTADVYTEVAEELAEAAAVAIAAFIPRRAKTVPAGGGNDR